MRAIVVNWAIGLLAVTAFAGCIASEEEAPATGKSANEPQVNSGPAEFDESTGAIQGLVTSDEIEPIAGAQVGIIGTDISVLTDEAGAFTLSRLEPGVVTVAAGALGFEAAAAKVSVAVGEVATQNFALVPLPSDEPYSHIETRKALVSGVMIKLTPQCMYNLTGDGNTLAKTCQGTRTGCQLNGAGSGNCEVHYTKLLEENAHWKTILGEATWAGQTGVTGRGFFFDISAPNVPRGTGGSINQGTGYTFFKMQPKPPIIWRIDNSTTLIERKILEKDWCCDWFYRLFPGYCDLGATIDNCQATPDYGIMQDGAITVYMSFFFKEPAPPGYTSLKDS